MRYKVYELRQFLTQLYYRDPEKLDRWFLTRRRRRRPADGTTTESIAASRRYSSTGKNTRTPIEKKAKRDTERDGERERETEWVSEMVEGLANDERKRTCSARAPAQLIRCCWNSALLAAGSKTPCGLNNMIICNTAECLINATLLRLLRASRFQHHPLSRQNLMAFSFRLLISYTLIIDWQPAKRSPSRTPGAAHCAGRVVTWAMRQKALIIRTITAYNEPQLRTRASLGLYWPTALRLSEFEIYDVGSVQYLLWPKKVVDVWHSFGDISISDFGGPFRLPSVVLKKKLSYRLETGRQQCISL